MWEKVISNILSWFSNNFHMFLKVTFVVVWMGDIFFVKDVLWIWSTTD